MASTETYDAVIVGGGPAGATAASDLARAGRRVLLLERGGRIKPCGGAIPPRAIDEFAIPDEMMVAKVRSARIVSPRDRKVDMPIDGGFVGMVDRASFDPWLRRRAAGVGADLRTGRYLRSSRDGDGTLRVHFAAGGRDEAGRGDGPHDGDGRPAEVRTRLLIGADGAVSQVARQHVAGADKMPCVFAYHEITEAPKAGTADWDGTRCDVVYRGTLSPDFYSWIFPHGDTVSIGTGSLHKGFSLRGSVAELRRETGMAGLRTLRREGAPIPLHPLPRWDNGRDVLLAGDAAGVVAPASGEGIFYAMTGGRLAAQAAAEFLESGDARDLRIARKRFMRTHGPVFWILGVMQRYWYANDQRRERFVTICKDLDVQQLTWDAYMNKELVKARPLAHARIFFKNIAHLSGLVPA